MYRADLEISDTIDLSDKIEAMDAAEPTESERTCLGLGILLFCPAEKDLFRLLGGGADLR